MKISNDSYEVFLGIVKNNTPYIVESNINSDKEENLFLPLLLSSPSELIGFSEKEDKKIRFFCTTLIQETGIVLKLPQITILTAMNIFQRFYWRKSFLDFEPFYTLSACLSLAVKTEETFRRNRDIITCVYYVYRRKETKENDIEKLILDITGDFYNKVKTNVMIVENHILKELGFYLYEFEDHPHKYLLHFIKILKGTRDLLQRSWNYLNDAYRTSLVVHYPSHVLASSAIFLAARVYYFVLPDSVPWWEAFETKIEDIQEVCAELLKLNEIEKVDIRDVRYILKKHYPYKSDYEEYKKRMESQPIQSDPNKKPKRREKYVYYEKKKKRKRSRTKSLSSRRHKRSRKEKRKEKHKRRRHSSSSHSSSSSSSINTSNISDSSEHSSSSRNG